MEIFGDPPHRRETVVLWGKSKARTLMALKMNPQNNLYYTEKNYEIWLGFILTYNTISSSLVDWIKKLDGLHLAPGS